MANRLSLESSPYLLQHGENPVDWYPWGPEAFERARREDRPILLSIGYSACHWCHVMEHESFADPETAATMNDLFVNIKVDREERPDVDAIYMLAVQQMSGQGGWPLTAFLTPDGDPFYGGTYFPPEPRHGLPSFRQVLTAVAAAYRDRRAEVDRGARDVREAIERGMKASAETTEFDEAALHRAFHGLERHFDPETAGFGGAPRFPQPMVLDFLLHYHARTGSATALSMVTHTLSAMARGGIHDQVGGGFHRYSVDARWFVPHFEKMLYDNALLARVLARAALASGDPRMRATAERTLDYLLAEMRHPEGGFFSSQDADSEGEEGRFYVWTADEIDDILGPGDGALVRSFYGVTAGGNWEGRNILHRQRTVEEAAADLGVSATELAGAVDRARGALYEARSRRVWPGLDDKVITGWNALAMHAFAEAGWIFARPDYVRAAIANAEFLLRELRIDGSLHRTWRNGVAKIPAFLEDHALLVDALLELYRATFDLRWVSEARAIADDMLRLFWVPDEENFYDAIAGEGALIVRPREINDNATPSGTSAAAHALTRLTRLTGEDRYNRIATAVVGRLGDVASRVPRAFGHLLCAASTQLTPPTEVAIVGDPATAATRALLDAVRSRFMPTTAVALSGEPTTEAAGMIPFLAGRGTVDGKPTAFVCQHYSCRLPVTTAAELAADLARVVPAAGDRA